MYTGNRTCMILNSNAELTTQRLDRMMKLAGKRRFEKIMKVWWANPERMTGERLNYKYFYSVPDCWEPTTFSDRLQNNGYYRNSPNNLDYYFNELVELLAHARKINLI